MAQSEDARSHTGEPTREMYGLLTPRDFELGTHPRLGLQFTPPPTVTAASDNTNRRVSWADSGRVNSLGLVQQARQNLKRSLAVPVGVSEAGNSITTRGRFSARAGGGGDVIGISGSCLETPFPVGGRRGWKRWKYAV